MKPPIKWAGSKQQLLPELFARVPRQHGRYFEPFLGGGAFFFGSAPCDGAVVLSDTNDSLIGMYVALRDAPGLLCEALEALARKYNLSPEARYYAERSLFNDGARCRGPVTGYEEVAHAARFILLNKTCFNGLYRENRKGEFNVPWGKRALYEPDIDGLLVCSKALKAAILRTCDFEEAVTDANKGDFVYFDPPYVPASASANFTSYQKEPFGPKEQERLRDVALNLKQRGVKVLLSNSDTPFVRKLYGRAFYMERVTARRSINCKTAKRGAVSELLIT